MTNTIYIHQPEKAVSFTRLPNFLFEAPTFTALPNEAKLLYAFILRRTELSRKNGWADEYGRMLVYIPQLTKRKSKLLEMKSRLPKERVEEQYGRQSNIIDYTYTNYDLAAVEADYEKTADELSRAQLALDTVNQRDSFEFCE